MTKDRKCKPIDLGKVKTYSLGERHSCVGTDMFAQVVEANGSFHDFIQSLPDVLAARDFKAVVSAISAASQAGKPVVMAMGAHAIKCGLSPLIIDMMERGIITAVATHGAAAIHDIEIGLVGRTSEDVQAALVDGSFGMAKETGDFFAAAAAAGAKDEKGLGRAIGELLNTQGAPNTQLSILAAAARLNLPATVHVAIGTDIVHTHPSADGATLGQSSHIDFRITCTVVEALEGGVWINFGSAVIMPEVFLKALSVARNLGNRVENFVTVNFDMLQHYRPRVNVVDRPTEKGYSITGHHEIMLPLLRMAVLDELAS